MRRQCVPERAAAAAAAALFCQHSATIVKWYFCAMCLFPRSLTRSPFALRYVPRSFVDWARLHFGKAPNVSIVAAGGGEGRRQRRPTKPRQGHKHHENMVLSGRQPAANEATERCRLQHLFGRLGPSRVRCSMCSMHAWTVVQCAGLPRHPIPLVSPPDT